MYCYDKKGKESLYKDSVKYKTLFNKAVKIIRELADFKDNNLMFDCEEPETKQHYYKAIDELNKFKDNLILQKRFIK